MGNCTSVALRNQGKISGRRKRVHWWPLAGNSKREGPGLGTVMQGQYEMGTALR